MASPMNFSVPPLAPIRPVQTPKAADPSAGDAFHSILTDAVAKVESFQQNAHQSIDRFLSGEGEELHQVALATQKAELSFDLFLQTRNKVVAAYEEIMRMQV